MKNIIITIKKELRAIIRDRKSLLMMALTPIFIPVFVFLMAYIYDMMVNKEQEVYHIGINYHLSKVEEELIKENNLTVTEYVSEEELNEAYENKEIVAYVLKINNLYTIFANMDSDEGTYINMNISSYLESYNSYLGQKYLAENNIDSNRVYHNITYTTANLQGTSFIGNEVINIAIIFTIMAMTLSAIYTATDLTAGEKERGTLETLLTYPIKSSHLIMGKYLAIVLSTLITLIISLILMTISLNIVQNHFTIFENIVLNLNIKTISLTLVILITYSFFIAGICIAIASFAKTYKEAQSTLTPVSLIICVPMFLEMLNFKLHGVLTFIPLLNHVFVLNDLFAGNINTINIIITIISSIIYGLLLVFVIVNQYKSEKILFSHN